MSIKKSGKKDDIKSLSVKKNFLPMINKMNQMVNSDKKNMFPDINIEENSNDGMSVVSEDNTKADKYPKNIDQEWNTGATKRNDSRTKSRPNVTSKV